MSLRYLLVLGAVSSVLVENATSDAVVAPPVSLKQHYYQYNGAEFIEIPFPKNDNMSDISASYRKQKQHKYTGQSNQDNIIHRMFEKKSNGYFIDLAANHYIEYSNTFRLEQSFGWRGLCIEPNSMYLEELVHRRDCEVLVNPISDVNGEEHSFHMNGVYGGIISPAKGVTDASLPNIPRLPNISNVVLKTVTLPTVLEKFGAPSVIDFLSLDVEGAELLVIKGMEGFWDRYTFLTIIIERPVKSLHMQLIKHDYWFLHKLNPWGDCLYVHSSTPKFEDHIKNHYPLNDSAVTFQKGVSRHSKGVHKFLFINAKSVQQAERGG